MTPTLRHITGALLAGIATGAVAGEPTALLNSERLEDAELVAYDSATSSRSAVLTFDGERRETSELVRWGAPRPLNRRPAIVFADGSWLLADRAWSPGGLVRIDADTIKLRRGSGWTAFDRRAVRWVILDAETAGLRVESLDLAPAENDLALLAEGDQLTGRVESLDRDALKFTASGAPLETAPDEVAALRLAGGASPVVDAACLVGLRDGSLLRATRLSVTAERFSAESQGAEITGEAATLALVQPLGGRVTYLSDLEPIDYRHTPYFDLAWPFARDRGLRGGPLAGGGARRAKGLAMHSAARLVYRLDDAPQRFRATLAVADPPADSAAEGSVTFRVYLVKEGAFESAYESPVVRSGDPATPIDIDCAGAAGLALVVDYADRGDAGDEALWLDARLVRTD